MYTSFKIPSKKLISITVHSWVPENPNGIVVLCHGMMEHAKRYDRIATKLATEGWVVFAPDHRGHGETSKQTGLGYFGDGADWFTVVDDIHRVIQHAQTQFPNTKLIIMGHSMGSFLAQSVCARHQLNCDALVLSGTGYEPYISTFFGKFVAGFLTSFMGYKGSGAVLHNIVFGPYNNRIKSPTTFVDWLSRDEKEVEAYIADPLCGEVCTISFFYHLFSGINWVYRKHNLKRIPSSVPVYFMSGTDDPLNKKGAHIRALANTYESLGHTTTVKLYDGARHEVLNETNRDEVENDLLEFLRFIYNGAS
jgi:alpha-beta hydrolase superfamily lysophospholipase